MRRTTLWYGLIGILIFLAACQPTVAGDSLVVTADAGGFVKGATVIANIGHDPCQDQQQIDNQANAQHPDRLVLAYVGNFYSPQVAPAYRAYGVFGLGQVYANCIRSIRAHIPAATQLIVTAVIACDAKGDPRGNIVLNEYLQPAVVGGRYPSGASVAPLANSRYSTALDDRMTPGHVFRMSDAGGVLRSTDRIHLTNPYGDSVYGGVLTQLAAGSI